MAHFLSSAPLAVALSLDTRRIEQLTGMKRQLNTQEGVFKVSVPRTDLAVTVAGVTVTPPMGVTSYAAFMPAGGQVVVMGDPVPLPQKQVRRQSLSRSPNRECAYRRHQASSTGAEAFP